MIIELMPYDRLKEMKKNKEKLLSEIKSSDFA